MKSKLFLLTFALAAVVLGAAFLLSFLVSPGTGHDKTPSALDNRDATPHYAHSQSTAKPDTATPDSASTNLSASSTITNTINPAELTGDAREKHIQQRLEELGDLSSKNDPISRDKILAELQNPFKQVREAALQAAIDFND